MIQPFPLTPRYRLDDEMPWLEGIDPSRHYWIWVNGDAERAIAIPGLATQSLDEFKRVMRQFRAMEPGTTLNLQRVAGLCTIHCISSNCYAIEGEVLGSVTWHLFDQETLDSLLMTAHPDWQCAPRDVDLGRRLLSRALETVAA